MINHIRIEQIEYELLQLQQEKGDYEDCCTLFKKEIIEEGEDINWLHQKHFDQCKDIETEMHDQSLLDLIKNNQKLIDKVQEKREELIETIDNEDQNHRLQCEAREDVLRSELTLLAVM